ncbi:hypothetical protein EDD16DRAFT_1710414 [Pisolithus croceorrhizus]|nr:hypothetical protein EDD16DRAFT_1710414 [Pisolithus croceorrhizus]KAI6124355.1 hypothetical protein EV401DRAFT_2068891 [Pisolithus croceorrhizus]KAI6159698.1 hypothetical protein EDD17DRAFT_1762165 [Pisolithus thermaeus]
MPSVAKGLPNSSEETPQQWSAGMTMFRASMVEPATECWGSFSGDNHPSQPPFSQVLKPGLAPLTTLDKLGFEPPVDPMIAQPPVTKTILSTKIVPPALNPCSHPSSPSPIRAPPSGALAIPGESSSIEETDVFNDKGDQASVVGCVPDAVLAVLTKGFKEIDEMVGKLAAHVKMPFHQVSDRYIHLHSHSNGPNLWNTYSMYFAKNMDCELACLPKGDQVAGTPTTDIHKRCFSLFKEEYKDTYLMILETWKEAKELENMGGTIAQQQQLFDKTKRNLNHTFTALSKAHGFEGMYLLARHVVDQDGGLGHVFMTPGAERSAVMPVMMRSLAISRHMSSEEFYDLAALFANCKCSNMVSLQAVHEVFKTPRKDSVVNEVEEISDPRDRMV